MKRIGLVLLSVLVIALAACGGTDAPATVAGPELSTPASSPAAAAGLPAPEVAVSAVEQPVSESAPVDEAAGPASEPANATLSDSYPGALSIRTQLALGTLQLEETDQALTVEQAGALLPLWQVLNTLETSGTAAQAELDAVVKQILNAMTGEQIAAIAAMRLTEDSLEGLALPGFGQGQRAQDGTAAGLGGGPGGGLGGGLGRAGGGPGGGLGQTGVEVDPAAMATRQAEMAEGGPALAAERFGATLVIRLLQTKTGDLVLPTGGLVAATLAEFGLTEQQVTAGLEAGQSFAEIVTNNGVDLGAVRQALVAAIESGGELQGTDAEAAADRLLEGGFGRGQSSQQP